MRSTRLATFAVVIVAFFASAVLANENENTPTRNLPAGEDSVRRGVQGPAGMFDVRIFLNINLSKDHAGKPVSLAPDLYYSISDALQIGLLHTLPMGWQTLPGTGLCLSGTDSGCPKVYNNIGFDLMYALTVGELSVSAHASFFVLSFADPSATMLTLGLAGKVRIAEDFALFFGPQIGIGITGRDNGTETVAGTGTTETFFLPVELEFQASEALQLKLFSGVWALSHFGDTYRIPLGIGGLYNINKSFDIGLRFSFDNLMGKVADGVGRADERSLSLLVAIRG